MSNDAYGWRWGMLFLGGTLAAGLIIATHLGTRSLMKTKLVDQSIAVKGYAERQIVSDRASWGGNFGVGDPNLVAAYDRLQQDREKLMNFLTSNGISKEAVQWSPVAINTIFKKDDKGNTTNQMERYWLMQPFAIGSTDVRLIEKIARNSAELIKVGVELHSDHPEFIYTKLNDLKSDLLADATRNARQRAQQIATNSGSGVGGLRSARQGVFQITPIYSTEVSGSGENDTTTVEKIVRAVVTVEFAIQ